MLHMRFAKPARTVKSLISPALRHHSAICPVAARPQARPPSGSAPKSTTVYVGKIAPSLDDSVVRQLLEACGPVKSWKRMTVGDPR